MENKILPKTFRIGNTSLLVKKRRVNTSAGCFLIQENKLGEIQLLVMKKTWPDGNERYVLPKGHKEGEETLEEAAHREVMEESGYTQITLLRYLGSLTYEIDWEEIQMKTDHYFLASLDSEEQSGKKPESYEDEVKVENCWIELSKALKLLTFENSPELHALVLKFVSEIKKF